MRNLMKLGFFLLIATLFTSCDNPTSDSDTNSTTELSLIEKLQSTIWMYESWIYEGGSEVYDPNDDNYKDANFYDFNENGMLYQTWEKDDEATGYIIYEEAYSLEDSVLIGCGRLMDPDTAIISFDDGNLIMDVVEDGFPYQVVFVPYSGTLPISSWLE